MFELLFGIILLWMLLGAIVILGFIFWIFMIVDVANRNFKNPNDKIVWVLIVVLVGIIGALIYYSVVKKKEGK